MDYKAVSFFQYTGHIYSRELEKTHRVEGEKGEKMNQSSFIDSSHRAKSMAYYADKAKDNFEALTNMLHQKYYHEDVYEEIGGAEQEAMLSADVSVEDQEAAEFYARGFWLD